MGVPNISIIIPAHNEEKRIKKTLENYLSYLKKHKKRGSIDFEIIVILNACTDNTLKVVSHFQKNNKELKILDFEQGGKGIAVIEGFKDALKRDSDLIGFVDADMATPPESFHDLVKRLQEDENVDVVIASRWMRESVIKTPQTLLRKIMSKGFNFLARSILSLQYSDTQCGAKLIRRGALEEIIDNLEITMWAFDIDMLYNLKKKGFKVVEIPTIWEDMRDSKISLVKVPFKMFSSVIRLRLIHSPFKFIVRMYDRLPERIKIHNI